MGTPTKKKHVDSALVTGGHFEATTFHENCGWLVVFFITWVGCFRSLRNITIIENHNFPIHFHGLYIFPIRHRSTDQENTQTS